jgi:hypothetical protein
MNLGVLCYTNISQNRSNSFEDWGSISAAHAIRTGVGINLNSLYKTISLNILFLILLRKLIFELFIFNKN